MEDKNSIHFLADLSDLLAISLKRRLSIPQDKSTELSLELVDEVRRMWGGVSVYICKTDTAALEAKYQEVWDAYRREGFSLDLCRRFDLSEQRIRQIIAVKRRERKQRVIENVLPLEHVS